MGTDKVKCAMANHAVGACLELEAKRLDEARKVISVGDLTPSHAIFLTYLSISFALMFTVTTRRERRVLWWRLYMRT